MLDLNWQAILIQIVGFLLLIGVLKLFLFKPITGILDERRSEVQATLDQVQEDRKHMEATRADYERRLANIEAEARERIQAAVKEAQTLRDQIVHDARDEGQRLIQRAEEEIERERAKAYVELRSELTEIAVGVATKIMHRTLDAKTHQDLIQEYIGQVGDGPAGPPPA